MTSLTKLELEARLTTPMLLALKHLSRLTTLYVFIGHDDDDVVDTMSTALIHVTSSLPSLMELEVDLNSCSFPSRYISVASSISNGIRDIDHKDSIWSLPKLRRLSISQFTGGFPAMDSPQLTSLSIVEWKPRRNARDAVDNVAMPLLTATSQSDPPVDQIWHACPSLVDLTIATTADDGAMMSHVIKPPWHHYKSTNSKLRHAYMHLTSWFANDIVDMATSWSLMKSLRLNVRHNTPITVAQVILNSCQQLETFELCWYPAVSNVGTNDVTSFNDSYMNAIGSGNRSHQYLRHLYLAKFSSSLLQNWSFPNLLYLSLCTSSHNLETYLFSFLARLPRLYHLTCRLDEEIHDDDSKRASSSSLPLVSSSPIMSSSSSSRNPLTLTSLRTLTLNKSADIYEPILRAASIGVQTIKLVSIDKASVNRFITICTESPMLQLNTLSFSMISFNEKKDTAMLLLLLETLRSLPHLMTLIIPSTIVSKVRSVCQMMIPKPRFDIEPIS
jgi:hypothetical protein